MKAILGRKAGMTQVFTTDGVMVPVTVIEVYPSFNTKPVCAFERVIYKLKKIVGKVIRL